MPHVNHFLSVPADLHAELRSLATQRGISLSDLIMESLLQSAEAHRQRGWEVETPTVASEFIPALRYAY